MTFEEIERPPRNRRHISDTDLDWDTDIETALLGTLASKKAVAIPLHRFHSSPAKGRLWKAGYHVAHRVLPSRSTVAAWLEGGPDPNAPEAE